MTVRDAIHIFQISQKNPHSKRITDSYRYLLKHLGNHFTDSHLKAITPDQIYQFPETLTEHMAKSTRRLRYAQVKAFFNSLINEKGILIKNPCQDSIMVKAFKSPRMKQKDILSRESVDEIIYRSKKIRDRLILELQARCGVRVGEVLNLRVTDITDRKLMIRQPKSEKDIEVAFMTESKLGSMICEDTLSPMAAVTASLWRWYQRSFSGTRILKALRCTWEKSPIRKQ